MGTSVNVVQSSCTLNRLTREEAAEYLGVSLSSLYGLERSGQLEGTFYRIGRRKIYITEKLKEWAENGGEPEMRGLTIEERRMFIARGNGL